LSVTPELRSWENTAAASVLAMIEPSSNPKRQSTSSQTATKAPASDAVTSTPMLASDNAGHSATRKVHRCVRSPPSSRMIASARLAMKKAAGALSNSICPTPSVPASMPTTRKISSNGGPKRANVLATTLRKSSRPTKNRMILVSVIASGDGG